MDIIQIVIAITGLTALGLTQFPVPKHWIKFAPIIGLIGQPFWLTSTYQANQQGIFILCCCYTVMWFIGLYRQWFANDKEGFKDFISRLKKTPA